MQFKKEEIPVLISLLESERKVAKGLWALIIYRNLKSLHEANRKISSEFSSFFGQKLDMENNARTLAKKKLLRPFDYSKEKEALVLKYSKYTEKVIIIENGVEVSKDKDCFFMNGNIADVHPDNIEAYKKDSIEFDKKWKDELVLITSAEKEYNETFYKKVIQVDIFRITETMIPEHLTLYDLEKFDFIVKS
jgi:hypothetical protein